MPVFKEGIIKKGGVNPDESQIPSRPPPPAPQKPKQPECKRDHEERRKHTLKLINDLFDQYPDADIVIEELIDYEPMFELSDSEIKEYLPVEYKIIVKKKI